jgi:hypothetical protein
MVNLKLTAFQLSFHCLGWAIALLQGGARVKGVCAITHALKEAV